MVYDFSEFSALCGVNTCAGNLFLSVLNSSKHCLEKSLSGLQWVTRFGLTVG